MPGFRNKRFTIYDAMEAAGIFEANPANSCARDSMSGESLYKGPVQYPKIFYHPTGEQKITVPGELVETKLGVKLLGQQKELITEVARSEQEEQELRDAGWHDHPAKSMLAGGREAPPMTAGDKLRDMEAELVMLRAQVAAGQTGNALERKVIEPTAS